MGSGLSPRSLASLTRFLEDEAGDFGGVVVVGQRVVGFVEGLVDADLALDEDDGLVGLGGEQVLGFLAYDHVLGTVEVDRGGRGVVALEVA